MAPGGTKFRLTAGVPRSSPAPRGELLGHRGIVQLQMRYDGSMEPAARDVAARAARRAVLRLQGR